jgi:hypothetical protein
MAHVARDGSGSSDRFMIVGFSPVDMQPPSRYDAVVEGFPRSADALSCNLVEGASNTAQHLYPRWNETGR